MNKASFNRGISARGWICAFCGDLITSIEAGRVEWLAGADERGMSTVKGLRLVHALCGYDDRREFRKDHSLVEGLPLNRFVGPDGLMLLLSLIAEAEMPTADLLEIVKRVHIPGYEQTRELFSEAIHGGSLAPLIGEGFYLQSEIQELLTRTVRQETPP
ncbi:MAG: hypothetical protein JWQ87_4882 [Candidatus Sulfotelmatobacter sp.]|nr:hypothetical protein [Candidatus Sulfotelmatobacter sp.]